MSRFLSSRRSVSLIALVTVAAILVAVDAHYALRTAAVKGKFAPESAFDGITSATEARVSIVRSDNPDLPEPVSEIPLQTEER